MAWNFCDLEKKNPPFLYMLPLENKKNSEGTLGLLVSVKNAPLDFFTPSSPFWHSNPRLFFHRYLQSGHPMTNPRGFLPTALFVQLVFFSFFVFFCFYLIQTVPILLSGNSDTCHGDVGCKKKKSKLPMQQVYSTSAKVFIFK